MDAHHQLSPHLVKKWTYEVEAELAEIEKEVEPLLSRRKRLEERKSLLLQLLASFDESSPSAPQSTGDARLKAPPLAIGAIGPYVEEKAIEILQEEGSGMHINEIHNRFREKGYVIPGAGKPVNITTHIRRSRHIGSNKRGVYHLLT